MDYRAEYRSKLRTPEEAVQVVKSGDWVDYGTALSMPQLLDAALAKRQELRDVKVRGNLLFGPIQIVEQDPQQERFLYHSGTARPMSASLPTRGSATISR